MKKSIFGLLLVVGILLPSQQAWSIEVLSAQELASHCNEFQLASESPDGQYCLRYIQGFIDGAITADLRVKMNTESESGLMDSIASRAMRTRLPERPTTQPASGYAEFCLGDPIMLAQVVNRVVIDLKNGVKSRASGGSARDLVYESLRNNYPCQAD